MKRMNIVAHYGGKTVTKAELDEVELKAYYDLKFDVSKYKDSTLIFIVTYTCLSAIQLCLEKVFETLDASENTYAVILDNNSSPDIQKYLKSLKHKKVDIVFIGQNLGKAIAVNNFGRRFIDDTNLPKTVVSIDPDILFSPEDFGKMIEASKNIKKAGMIGMRFVDNSCNPEINLFFPEKKIKGIDNNIYKLKCPFMATVAGPIFAVKGSTYRNVLKNRLFPKKFIAKYGGDDSATYDALRWITINGYLQGTSVLHLRSGNKKSKELVEYEGRG